MISSLFAAVTLGASVSSASAQVLPIPRVIHVVVPFAPGGGSDVLARGVAERLSVRLNTPVVVENRAGAGGLIGAAAVARAAADGSTLLFHSASLVTSAATSKNVPFNVLTDLVPLAMVEDVALLVGVSSKSGIHNPAEFTAAARAKTGGLTAGSPGVGSVTHMATELLAAAAKVPIRHIPYKGAGPALADVAAGEIDVLLGTYASLAPGIQSGRVIPVGVTSAQPNAAYPALPTMNSVAPGYEAGSWFAFFAPAGTPPEFVQRLNREINAASESSQVRELIKADGGVPAILSQEEVAQRVRKDYAMWRKLAVEKHIILD